MYKKPFFIITASLDLSGVKNYETLYFNYDNNLDYKHTRDYANYIKLSEQSILDEIVVSTNPLITIYPTPFAEGPQFSIGGAEDLQSPVFLKYAGPTGRYETKPNWNGWVMQTSEINSNPVTHFGHVAAKIPYDNDATTLYRYLAITVIDSYYDVGVPIIESGTVHVSLRIYPK